MEEREDSMNDSMRHLDELQSGQSPEEILAGALAACGFYSPVRAGIRLPGGKTAYPVSKGEYQIKMKWGLSANGYVEHIHVGSDTYEGAQTEFKKALLEAARELAQMDRPEDQA